MKLSTLLLIISTFSMFASNSFSQGMKVNLHFKDVTIKEVLREIKKQTNISFLYNNEELNDMKRVTLNINDNSVEEALNILLKKQNLAYSIEDNVIFIYKPDKDSQLSDQEPQNKRTLTGTVIDETDMPVIGAGVWVKETTNGTTTDMNGKFSLSISGYSTVVVISYLGYTTKEIEVRDRSSLGVIKLSPNTTELSEVVVVGFGQQKKESVIGSISSIKPDALKIPTGKVSNILAGRLSGIVAVNRSGEPGTGSEFYIRGISTFGANRNPLVLIDGIERSIDLIDPEDIESFSILKDATATAVYGVRGANGVILITTRTGEAGKPKINVRYEAGLVGPVKMPEMIDAVQFAKLYNEASGTNYYSEEAIQAYKDKSNPDLYPNVNWTDEMYKDFATTHRVNVNLTGGASVARYYVAGSLYRENSIFTDESDEYDSSLRYNKINFRARIDWDITKSTMLSVNFANIYETRRRPNASMGEIWDASFYLSPNAIPKRYSDGKQAGILTDGGNPYIAINYSGYSNDYWNSAQSLIGLTQDLGDILTPGLKANIKFSWDAYNSGTVNRSFKPQQWQATGVNENGEIQYIEITPGSESLGYSRSLDGRRTTYLEASLTYDRTFGKHQVSGLLLYNHKQLNQLNAGDAFGSLPYKNQGLAGRATYSFADRYFAEFNMGYNGSENFAKGHRFGFFPAGAVGWMISNEKFWSSMAKYIDMFKLRASYGIVGNDQIGGGRRFIYQETIVGGGKYVFGETGNYNPGSIRMGHWPNPDVSWEKSYKLNLGVELSFFNALKLEVDYFNDRRKGIFLQRASLPGMAGLSVVPWVNLGEMENKGFDATLQFHKQVGDFRLSALGNFTFARNKVINNDQPDYQYDYQNRRGKSFNQPFGLIAEKLFESQEEIDNSPPQFGNLRVGDIKYKDVNGDKVINELDEVAIGYTSIPEIVYGLGGTVGWKGFDFSVFFQGVAHTTIQSSGIPVYGFTGGSISRAALYEEVYNNRWSVDNPDPHAKYPRIDITNNPNNNRFSTLRAHDGSFLRLKNVELGYTLPGRIVKKWFMSSLRFYLSGVNVLTFSKFKMWDPELGNGDGSTYPINRTFTLGVNINF